MQSKLTELSPEQVEILVSSDEARRLRDAYLAAGVVGSASANDAYHVAIATVARADMLVQSSCTEGLPGSIITISSQMGHVGGPGRTVYCASKFAVEGMSKAMAIELGKHNIRVNTICPTFVETEMTSKTLADAEFRSWVLGKIKLGRLARVQDMMGPILLLASDASAMVTGSSLMVDGGWTAH